MRSACLATTLLTAALVAPSLAVIAQEPGRVADANGRATAGLDARRIPAALNFANALLNQRRYELAAEEYERFLRTGPAEADAADALYGLARAKLFLLKYDEARRHLEAFLKLAPDHPGAPAARFRLGEAAFLMRDLPAAREALEAYVQAHPDHAHADVAWPYLGDVRLGLGDLKGAREAYEEALADHPDGPLADRSRYYLARVLAAQDEPDAALDVLAPVTAREGSDWSDRAKLQAGQIQAGAGKLAEAVATFESVERANPTGLSVPEARLRRAEALLGLERFDEAEALLDPLATDPTVPGQLASQAGYDLGALRLDRRNDPSRALAAFDAALGREPGEGLSPMLLYRSAEALTRLNRPGEARVRYLKVSHDYPKDAWADRALLAAARGALETRDVGVARQIAAQLPAQYPGSPLRANARLIEARAASLAGGPADAVPILRALLDDPADAPAEVLQAARYELGQAYKALGQPEKAAEVLAEVAATPSSPAPVAAGARYALGQARFEAGQYADAVDPLGQFVEAAPEDPLAPYALAYLTEAHHRLGQADESDAALERLAAGWPDHESLLRLRLRLGEEAAQAEQHDRAAALLKPVAEAPPHEFSARARSGLGWSLVGLERYDEAAAAFAAAIEVDPESPTAAEDAYMAGWSLERAGKADEALAAYETAATNYPDTPRSAESRLARARLLAREGRPGEAADAFAAYLDNAPPDAEGLDAIRAERAYALRDASRLDEADAAFAKLDADFPDSPAALAARLDRGVAAYRDRDLEAAAQALEPIAADGSKATPGQVQTALYWLGRIAIDRGDWPAARATFGRLADDFPDGPHRDHARFYRAEAAFRADDPAAAAPDFAALVEGGDLAADPWRATAWLRRVQCLVALKQWSSAISEAESLADAVPDFPQMAEVHYARGRALQSQPAPRFDDARAAYLAAIEAAPGSELAARAQFMRGETYFFQKSYRDAEREFLAVALTYAAPDWQARALLEAGKVAEADARPADARSSYQKLIEQFPDSPAAAEAKARLEALAAS